MQRTAPLSLRLALFFSVATYSSMQAIVIPAIPHFIDEFDSNLSEATWLVSGFLVTGAVVPPIAGRVGDLIGHRRTLVIIQVIIYLLGLIIAVLATSMWMLVAARMIQGLGAAFISLGYSIARNSYPPEKLGSATGLISTTIAVAGGLGLAFSGPITALVGPRAIFYVPMVMALLGLVLMYPLARKDHAAVEGAGQLNWWGGALFVSSLSFALLSITLVGRDGWSAPGTAGSAVAAGALLAAWARVEGRAQLPLVDVRLFVSRRARRVGYATLLLGAVSFATYDLMPAFLASDRLGFDTPTAVDGLIMLPLSLGGLAVGVLSPWAVPRLGLRRLLIYSSMLNLVVLSVALVVHTSLVVVVVLELLHGLAIGLAYASIPALMMLAVPDGSSGVAAGMYSTLRSVGGALGAQVLFAILASGGSAPGAPAFGVALLFLVALSAIATVVGFMVQDAGPRVRPGALADEQEGLPYGTPLTKAMEG